MSDRVEISRRIERLAVRVERRGDYGTLLATGQVLLDAAEVDDPQAWRTAIKHQARADRIKVRTGISDGLVWALLHEGDTEARRAESNRYFDLLRAVVPRAVEHRHEPLLWLRDGEEALFRCERCEALGYADPTGGPLVGGDLFEQDCPHDDPPEPTLLSMSLSPSRPR